jgi:hypothetical protein
MTLTEFLLARIAEDEAKVREGMAPDWRGEKTFYSGFHASGDDWGLWYFNVPPARLLAECEAKRRIVAEHRLVTFTDVSLGIVDESVCVVCHAVLDSPDDDSDDWAYPLVQVGFPCTTLRALALPYAGRPDFRQEWAVSQTAPAPLA